MASIPVIAVHPVEKVCSKRAVVRGWIGEGATGAKGSGPLMERRIAPYPSIGRYANKNT
jgi:hypothetical protein